MQTKKTKRPPWDEYFLDLAQMVKKRSNCLRMDVGAVIVQGKHIIATGYNGTPAGVKNCDEGGCKRCLDRQKNKLKEYERKDLCICVHAEQNAIFQSSFHGVSTKGAVMYSTISPCTECAKAIISAGVKTLVYTEKHYQNDPGLRLLTAAGVKVIKSR